MLPMQTAFPNYSRATELFTRERRKQRMLHFLETFDRRSWPAAPDTPFLLPLSRVDRPEPAAVLHHSAAE